MDEPKIHTHTPNPKWQKKVCYKCRGDKLCTWHHIGRRRYSKEWVWLCDNCHRWVHQNPAEAKKFGLYKEIGKI